MTIEALMSRIAYELCRTNGPIPVKDFVGSFYPHDVEVGQLLMRAFDERLLRGRLTTNLVDFDGHISDVAPDWGSGQKNIENPAL